MNDWVWQRWALFLLKMRYYIIFNTFIPNCICKFIFLLFFVWHSFYNPSSIFELFSTCWASLSLWQWIRHVSCQALAPSHFCYLEKGDRVKIISWMVGVQGSGKNVQNMQILKWFWSLAISKVKKSVFFSRADRDGGKPANQGGSIWHAFINFSTHSHSTQTREGIKFTECSGRCQDECISQRGNPIIH